MTLGKLTAAILLAAMMSNICAAADQRLLVLEGSWVKWGAVQWGAGATVTYAFAQKEQNTPGARNCAFLRPFYELIEETGLGSTRVKNETRAAFGAWERVTGLRFIETRAPAEADIVIGTQGRPGGRAFTNVELDSGASAQPVTVERGFMKATEPSSPGAKPDKLRTIHKALICLNQRQKWKIGFDGNLDVYDLRYTLTHEIGHAIGLDHPGAAGALMGFRYDERQQGLTKSDIDAVQRLYGRPTGQ